MDGESLLDKGDCAVDGGVVGVAVGNGEDFVSVLFEEADGGARANGELGFITGVGKLVGDEGDFVVEKVLDLVPNGGMEDVFAELAAGAKREVGTIVHKCVHGLFKSCRLLIRGVVVNRYRQVVNNFFS